MKIWAQKNNKICLEKHFYFCVVEGNIFNLVVMEAKSYRRCGGTNNWDVFFSPQQEVFHFNETVWMNKDTHWLEKEMTKYDGVSGYFGLRLDVSTLLGEEKEIHFPRWEGVSFKNLNNEQFRVVVEMAKKAQAMGFGTHGCFTYTENLLDIKETIKEWNHEYIKYSWGIEIPNCGVFRWEVPSSNKKYTGVFPVDNVLLGKIGVKVDMCSGLDEFCFNLV